MLKREFKPSSRVYVGRTRLERPKVRVPRRQFPKFLVWIFVGIATIGILSAFFWLPAIRVKEVYVSGTRIEDPKEIAQLVLEQVEGSYAYLIPKNSIFFYPARAIEAEIGERYPRIGTVRAEYRSATSLIVTLAERVPKALWCGEKGSCVFLDDQGFAFARAPHFSGPVFFEIGATSTEPAIGSRILPDSEFAGILALLGDLKTLLARSFPTLGVPVGVWLDAANSYVYRIQYPDESSEWELIVGRDVSPVGLLKNVELALGSLTESSERNKGKKLQYLDARLPQKLFSKFKE